MNYQIKHEDGILAVGTKKAILQFISKVFDIDDVKENIEFSAMTEQIKVNKITKKSINSSDSYTIKLDGKFYINSYDLIIIDSLITIFGLDYDVAESIILESNVIIDSTIGRIEIIKNNFKNTP